MPEQLNQRLIQLTSSILTICGIVYIASASSYWSAVHYPNSIPFWIKQLVFAVIGYLLFLLISRKVRIPSHLLIWLYAFGIIVLLTVWIPGLGVVRNGARGWISLMGFYFQPAELAKITTLLFVAQLIHLKKHFFIQLFVVIVPCIFLMLQPDFGSTFLLLAAFCCVLFIGGIRLSVLFFSFAAGAVGLAVMIISAPYRLKRITAYLDPWEDPLGAGFQAIQSLLAIGPAGWTGWGIGESRQKLLYLPEPQNDFIFALIVEESGFLMGLLICLVYITWGIAGFTLAIRIQDSLQGFIIIALCSLILIQAFVNLGVVSGLLPVTGVTLPFISYGGSSLLICWIISGLILAFYRQGKETEEWKK